MLTQRTILNKHLSRQEQLEAKFREFHEAHPEVYGWFEAFAFELIRNGWKSHSAYTIMGRVRYEAAIHGLETTEYKINNNHIPHYARLFLKDHPRHEGFFTIRELTTENREPDNE